MISGLINNFDKHGNYNVGISDQLVFPQIDYDNVEQRRGLTLQLLRQEKISRIVLFIKGIRCSFAKTESQKIIIV